MDGSKRTLEVLKAPVFNADKSQMRNRDMSTATIAFDQIEREADQTLAIVLWAKHVRYALLCAALMQVLSRALRGLVRSLSAEKLDMLSFEQTVDLKKKLSEVYSGLEGFVTFYGVQRMKASILYRRSIEDIEERTEDLSDIIEELELAGNKDFRSLLSECVEDINSKRHEGLLAHV